MITYENLLSIGFKKNPKFDVMERGDISVYFEFKDYSIERRKKIAQSFWDKLFNRPIKYEYSFIPELKNLSEQQEFEWLKNNG